MKKYSLGAHNKNLSDMLDEYFRLSFFCIIFTFVQVVFFLSQYKYM